MKLYLFILACPLLFGVNLQAQIRKNSQKYFPDSLAPLHSDHPTSGEIIRILLSGNELPGTFHKKQVRNFASVFGDRYAEEKDSNKRIRLLQILSWYWYHEEVPDSSGKYIRLALHEIKKHPSADPLLVAKTYKMAGYALMAANDFLSAYHFFSASMAGFRNLKRLDLLEDSYSGLLLLYQKLALYDRVIATADTCIENIRQNNARLSASANVQFILLQKAKACISKFADTRQASYAAQARDALRTVIRSRIGTLTDWNLLGYNELVRLLYYERKFGQALRYAGIADRFAAQNGVSHVETDVRNSFRGLCLIESGAVAEGMNILKRVNTNHWDSFPSLVLGRLVDYERKKGNYSEALRYQTQLLQAVETKQRERYSGTILELEGKYSVASRDLQISKLQERKSDLSNLILLTLFSTTVVVMYFLYRVQMSRIQQRKLLFQIDEITYSQSLKIAEAEAHVQKINRHGPAQ